MFELPAWDLLGIIALAFLAISLVGRRNATWSCLLVGFVIGVVIAVVYLLKGSDGFNWTVVRKACTVATIAGAVIDIVNFIVSPRRKRI